MFGACIYIRLHTPRTYRTNRARGHSGIQTSECSFGERAHLTSIFSLWETDLRRLDSNVCFCCRFSYYLIFNYSALSASFIWFLSSSRLSFRPRVCFSFPQMFHHLSGCLHLAPLLVSLSRSDDDNGSDTALKEETAWESWSSFTAQLVLIPWTSKRHTN